MEPSAEQQARDAAAQAGRQAVGEGGMPNLMQEQLNWFENLMAKMVTAAMSTTASLKGCKQKIKWECGWKIALHDRCEEHRQVG